MNETRAVRKAREDLAVVKAKLAGELKFGEAMTLATEYDRLLRFIHYRTQPTCKR
jgi:hypothetical protein